MTDKELKKLRRSDLLEMLIAQSKEVESLKMQLQEAQEKLENRNIAISSAGSIAEAALGVNQIFEIAQKTADQYIENVQRIYASTQVTQPTLEPVVNESLVAMPVDELSKLDTVEEPMSFIPPVQPAFIPPVQPIQPVAPAQPVFNNPLWQQPVAPVAQQPAYVPPVQQPAAPVAPAPVAPAPVQATPAAPAVAVSKKSVVKPVKRTKR